MLEVDFVIWAPIWVLCQKSVFRTNDLSFEVGSEGWVVFCQSCLEYQLSSLKNADDNKTATLHTLDAQISA